MTSKTRRDSLIGDLVQQFVHPSIFVINGWPGFRITERKRDKDGREYVAMSAELFGKLRNQVGARFGIVAVEQAFGYEAVTYVDLQHMGITGGSVRFPCPAGEVVTFDMPAAEIDQCCERDLDFDGSCSFHLGTHPECRCDLGITDGESPV